MPKKLWNEPETCTNSFSIKCVIQGGGGGGARGGGGEGRGHSQYILVGVCPGCMSQHTQKGGLRHGHNQKGGS